MNSKTQLSLLFVFLAVVSISAFSYFSNSDDEITTIIETVPEEEIIEEEKSEEAPAEEQVKETQPKAKVRNNIKVQGNNPLAR